MTLLQDTLDALRDLSRQPDALCLGVLIFVLLGCAACETIQGPGRIPECPAPTLSMIDEAHHLERAPAIADYLGRIELYCAGIEAMNDG